MSFFIFVPEGKKKMVIETIVIFRLIIQSIATLSEALFITL